MIIKPEGKNMKKFRLPILILVLIISLATLVACGGGNEPAKITGATVDGGELRFVMSDGTRKGYALAV